MASQKRNLDNEIDSPLSNRKTDKTTMYKRIIMTSDSDTNCDDEVDDLPLAKRKSHNKTKYKRLIMTSDSDDNDLATHQGNGTKISQDNWDEFCWKCHKESDREIKCSKCILTYHKHCMPDLNRNKVDWVCPECRSAEMPVKTTLNDNDFVEVLKYAIERIIRKQIDKFSMPKGYIKNKLIKKPLTLDDIVKKATDGLYSKTYELVFDFQLLVHNCHILKKCENKLEFAKKEVAKAIENAKKLYNNCMEEVHHYTLCGDCYIAGFTEARAFTAVCSQPHLILWVRFEAYPYWPAKLMKISNNRLEVHFFKEHNTARVSHNDCYLYSKEDPNVYCTSQYKADIQEAVKETACYIKNIEQKFGKFEFAPKFTKPIPSKLDRLHLDEMIPGFRNPELRIQCNISDESNNIDMVPNNISINFDDDNDSESNSTLIRKIDALRQMHRKLATYLHALKSEYHSEKEKNVIIMKENQSLKAELDLIKALTD
ncbi:protein kinase C-binding protein 1-like isoform X2 [Contarinia nasturtii]|nr:protein kinase C-binding protein 1-like isoform X2 [Contarinia nasturtii]